MASSAALLTLLQLYLRLHFRDLITKSFVVRLERLVYGIAHDEEKENEVEDDEEVNDRQRTLIPDTQVKHVVEEAHDCTFLVVLFLDHGWSITHTRYLTLFLNEDCSVVSVLL